MSISEILATVQYVTNQQGQKTAVQLDLPAWEALRRLLEDLEDRAEIEEARDEDDELLAWEDVLAEYKTHHALKTDV